MRSSWIVPTPLQSRHRQLPI